ncbi:Kynurenine formamidase [Gryllus bimaculatus]|nr:Kynurenine formamidase [Gryllus bimaculatus]
MASRWLVLTLLAAVGKADECRLSGPLELSRTLSTNSPYVTVPFTPGTLQDNPFKNTRYRINDFCVGEHTGTHLDSPFHFSESGWSTDQIPLNRLIANGVFLNVTEQAAGNASFRLQPSHVDAWVERHGPFPDNAVLLVSFGWAQRFANRTLYLGTASTNFTEFRQPGISVEAARRLANIDQLVGVGVDTASVDAPGSGDVHVILAAKNMYNLEHVDLDQPCLPAKGFKVFSMPVKVQGGTGAPARVIVVPY